MRGGRGEVPAPLFMGTGRVQLAISPRTFLVTPARIVRARSTRLQRLRPHDQPHRGPQGGNCPWLIACSYWRGNQGGTPRSNALECR